MLRQTSAAKNNMAIEMLKMGFFLVMIFPFRICMVEITHCLFYPPGGLFCKEIAKVPPLLATIYN
jgi:hypothetical protein